MPTYVVHPGTVTLLNGQTETVDAGTLAARYGLSPGEYDINLPQQETSQDGSFIHIHLHPRTDGKYRNIKTLLGDNGTDIHYDKPVGWRKRQRERRRYI